MKNQPKLLASMRGATLLLVTACGIGARPCPAAEPPATSQTLLQAIESNDTELLRKILPRNTNLVNGVFYTSRRPLHVAASKGRTEIVEVLLKHGADPNLEGDSLDSGNAQLSALQVAIWYNHPAVFKRLLEGRANPNFWTPHHGTPLHTVFEYHRDGLAEDLLSRGANPYVENHMARSAFELAIAESDGRLVPRMLKARASTAPITNRAALGAMGLRRQPESRDAFMARRGVAMLEAAVQRGQVEAVEALLDARVPVAAAAERLTLLQTLELAAADARKSPGFDASHWTRVGELLRRKGCSDDPFSLTAAGNLAAVRKGQAGDFQPAAARDAEGQGLLHWSVRADRLPLTEFWLAAGVSPAQTNRAGQTPLHLAAARGLADQIRVLLAAHAPADARETNGHTPIEAAIAANQAEAIRLLLPADRSGVSGKRGPSTPLHDAAKRGDSEALTRSLAAKPNLEAADEFGFRPLHTALLNGHLQAAAELLKAGADINGRDAAGNTPLHLAVTHPPVFIHDEPPLQWYRQVRETARERGLLPYLLGNSRGRQHPCLTAVVFLLASGADAGATNAAGQTLAHALTTETSMAFGEDRLTLLKLLGKGGGSVDAADAAGETALHRAVRGLDPNKVDELIAVGADINARNRQGRTPVHAALEKMWGWPGPLPALLRAGADVNLKDNEGMTPLHVVASSSGSFRGEAIKALLQAGAQPDAQDKQGRTPLHIFLTGAWPWHDAGGGISMLMSAGADAAKADEQGRTPLHYFATLGQSADFFLRGATEAFGTARVDFRARDKEGNTPLHLAAQSGSDGIANWLVQHGASFDDTNFAGATPRSLAMRSTNRFSPFASSSRTDIFQAAGTGKLGDVTNLLNLDTNLLNSVSSYGATPLRMAVMSGRTNVVEYLSNAGAQWDAFSAVVAGRADKLREILGRRPEAITNVANGMSLLHRAVLSADAEILELLLANKADVHAMNLRGMTPLGLALLSTNVSAARQLTAHAATENLFDAIYLNHPAAVLALLAANKPLLQATNPAGHTPVEIAAATGRSAILKLLLPKGAAANSADSRTGQTPLHLAAARNRVDAAALLLARGANVNALDQGGCTPLHLAASQGAAEAVALLLKHRADPKQPAIPSPTEPGQSYRVARTTPGNTPLHLAAQSGHTNAMTLLLKAGASVHATNSVGMTPLDLLTRRGMMGPQFPGVPLTSPEIDLQPVPTLMPWSESARAGRKAAIQLLEKSGAKRRDEVFFPGAPGW